MSLLLSWNKTVVLQLVFHKYAQFLLSLTDCSQDSFQTNTFAMFTMLLLCQALQKQSTISGRTSSLLWCVCDTDVTRDRYILCLISQKAAVLSLFQAKDRLISRLSQGFVCFSKIIHYTKHRFPYDFLTYVSFQHNSHRWLDLCVFAASVYLHMHLCQPLKEKDLTLSNLLLLLCYI